ncbi:S-layer homology domain-containing protein [Sporosarcina sp.]|uniref:S-layer homology domain-containing protein n=1 Tax=Sporosarcina sp. TaxID=49982 RepID=UPI00262D19C7|nr:S-layer homology domain-containing protein [Sporosarcina sp.]
MKSKLIKSLVVVLIVSVISVSSIGYVQSKSIEFTDVPKHRAYYEAVISLSSRGYISGYPDGTFRPAANVTRGQAAKIIANVLQLDTQKVKNPGFIDISTAHQYYGHIAALVEAGVISGYEDQTFKPNQSMTRAHMSKMIIKGFNFEEADKNAMSPFTDVSSKQWFAPYVESLRILNITTGTTPTTYSPGELVTRSQLASFVTRSEKVKSPDTPVIPEPSEEPDFVIDSIK